MRPKALSSPDFMKSYKPAYDAERDWPQVEADEADSALPDEVDSQQNVSSEGSRRGSIEYARRGSSEDRLRRRKRFETDRV